MLYVLYTWQIIHIVEGNTTIDPIILPCRVDKELPTNDIYPCIEPNVQFTDWNEHLPFQHEDMCVESSLIFLHLLKTKSPLKYVSYYITK